MTVSRRRATVIKVPDATPGLVCVDGVEHAYTMTGVWKSATAPVPNLVVDAVLDESGHVIEIIAVDPEQLARERLRDVPRRAKRAIYALMNRLTVALINRGP